MLGNERVRPGTVSTGVLMALPLLLMILAMLVWYGTVQDTGTELQAAADAAALASATAMANDALLSDPGAAVQLAAEAASTVAGKNYVRGQLVDLPVNPTTDSQSNRKYDPQNRMQFGTVDTPIRGKFTGFPATTLFAGVNSVRIELFGNVGNRAGTGLGARAIATLDPYVVGIRPSNDNIITPLIPIGLYCNAADHSACSWNPAAIGDYTVVLGNNPNPHQHVQAALLRIGAIWQNAFPGITATQIQTGVTRRDLATDFAGSFVLGGDNTILMDATGSAPVSSADPSNSDPHLQSLTACLNQARIWPLFQISPVSQRVNVVGFVGARLTSVRRADHNTIVLTLRPAVLQHPSITTDPRRFLACQGAQQNLRTLFRVRLVD